MKNLYSINEFFDKNEYASEEATSFLLKVKKENPELHAKMKTILASRGLEKAKEAYSKYEEKPIGVNSDKDIDSLIKKYLKEKNPLKYFKQLIEKEMNSKYAYLKLITFPKYLKNVSIQKLIIADITGKQRTFLTQDEEGTDYKESIWVSMYLNIDNNTITPYFKINVYINNTSMKFSKVKQEEVEKIVDYLTEGDLNEEKLYSSAVKISRLIDLLNKS